MANEKNNDLNGGGMEVIETAFEPRVGIKAPYGKLEEIGPPKDYKSANPDLKALPVDPSEARPYITISFAMMPPATLVNPDLADKDGYTEWIVKGNTKSKVLKYPGFPKSVPKIPHSTPSCEVRKVPSMGMGLFATRDLKIGELILAERPLLIAPRAMDYVSGETAGIDNYTTEQLVQIQLFETERFLQTAVRRMDNEGRRTYMSLANAHKEDGSGPCLGILRTNVYAIGGIVDGPDGVPITSMNGYCAVANLGSRINHSCLPNVSEIFDVASFSLQFYARRKIKAGEQLFFSYHGNSLDSVKERQKVLEPYGVVCKCPLCANATPESDRRLQDLIHRCDMVCIYVARSLLKPYMRKKKNSPGGIAQDRELNDMIRKLEDMHEECEKSGQFANEPVLVFLHKLYLRSGEQEKAHALAEDYVRYLDLRLLLEKDQGN